MDKIEQLKIVRQSYLDSESELRSKIFSEENGKYFYIPSFEGNAEVQALYSVYIEADYQKAREYFFKSARVAEFMSITYDWRIMDSGINKISSALLSDNEELIKRYATLRNPINNEIGIGFQLPNAVQNILLGDSINLANNIRNLERFVKNPRFKWWGATVEVLKGFINKDEKQIEMGLQEMIKTHKKRNTDPLVSKFFSIDTAGFCKLAWVHGYKVDLKNDLVPIELMPIRPLTAYEDYEFLK